MGIGLLLLSGLLLGMPPEIRPGPEPQRESESQPEAQPAPPAPAEAEDIGLTENVEISGRLGASRRGPASPGSVILDGDDLRASGARSLPEALARELEIQSVDQVGNGRQLSLDLRGFSGAEGATALVVDGVRMNDADTNIASWELVGLDDVERVEISAGPRGALVGGGSLAGTVSIERRRPSPHVEADIRLRSGSHGLLESRATLSGPVGSWRLLASGAAFDDDGFRAEAGSRERSARLAAERDLGAGTLSFGWSHLEGRWRQPGALTEEDLRRDPSVAPFNMLDAQATTQDLATTRYERDGGRTRLVLVGAFRSRESDILTTGRTQFGHRSVDSQQSLSLTMEGETRLVTRPGRRLALRWGLEAARERLHPRGFETDDTSDGEIHAEDLSSAMDLDWDRGAAFAGASLELGSAAAVELALRHDRSSVAREGGDISSGRWETVSDARDFAATSLRLGLGRERPRAPGRLGLAGRVAWEESFLAPSAIQLFAYPGFFSNPDLLAQRGRGPAATLAVEWERLALSLDVFETRVEREIAYDDEARRNVNAGSTRRRGAQLRLQWQASGRVRLSFGHAQVDATYRGGFPLGTRVRKGARVPLVARSRTSLGAELGPWRGFSARVDLLRAGSAPLSNDFDGSEPVLRPRCLLSVVLGLQVPAVPGLSLEFAGENLLDDPHPSRGIESWGERYFTPPVPRRFTLGVAWQFR